MHAEVVGGVTRIKPLIANSVVDAQCLRDHDGYSLSEAIDQFPDERGTKHIRAERLGGYSG